MSGGTLGDESEWPRVFFAFKHNEPLLTLTGILRDRLAQNQIRAYRLTDNPRPGTNLRDRASRAIQETDGLVLFWSKQGAQSQWVKIEYDHAKRFGKPVCLLLFRGVARPSDWHPDIEWVSVEGVRIHPTKIPGLPMRSLVTAIVGQVETREPDFSKMIRKILIFARDAARRRLSM